MATTSVSCRRENLSDTKIQATKLQRLAERREARRAQRGREKKARARARTAAAAARGGDTCEEQGWESSASTFEERRSAAKREK
jgi:hypothetical protein